MSYGRSVSTPEKRHEHQQPRRTAEFPADLIRDFRDVNRRGGPSGSTLVYGWLMDAVQRVRAGLPVPPADAAPPAEPGQKGILWTQTAEEFGAWKAELEAAGSSVRAVLAVRIRRYIEASGDPLSSAEGDPERELVSAP